jgi:hypothetical protein
MGFRMRKSIQIVPDARLNVSSSGIGYSAGSKGMRVTRHANGRVSHTLSISGTGISHSQTLRPAAPSPAPTAQANARPLLGEGPVQGPRLHPDDVVLLAAVELHQDAGDLDTAIWTVEQAHPTAIAAVSLTELYCDAGRDQDIVDLTNGIANQDDATVLLLALRGRFPWIGPSPDAGASRASGGQRALALTVRWWTRVPPAASSP